MSVKEENNRSQKLREGICLALLACAFILMCCRLIIKQPAYIFWDSLLCPPDEADRYRIPRFIYEYGRLPFGTEDEAQISGYGGSYAYLPGLSYILMAWVMRFASLFTELESSLIIAGRSVNMLLGLVMLVFVYKTGKRLFEKPFYAFLLTLLFMFLPQTLFVCSYINLDALALLSITLMIYFLLAMMQDGVSYRNCSGFAVGAVCCLLSYYNCYAFLPGSVFFFVFLFFEKKEGKLVWKWKEMLRYGLFILLLCAVGAGWWFVRSALLHDGDFLGLTTLAAEQKKARLRVGLEMTPPPAARGESFFQFLGTQDMFFWLFCSFIGGFGSMAVFATKGFYQIYLLLWLVAGAGVVISLVKDKKSPKEKAFALMLFLGVVFNFALWLIYSYALDYQCQGRYVLPSALPFFICCCFGYRKLLTFVPEKGRPFAAAGLAVAFFALCAYFIYGVAIPAYQDFSLLG